MIGTSSATNGTVRDTGPWRETSINALRTDAARQLAQAINSTEPSAWWAAFAASYHELRASAQGRSRQQLAGHSPPAQAAETD
jgi:hypothetical protein